MQVVQLLHIVVVKLDDVEIVDDALLGDALWQNNDIASDWAGTCGLGEHMSSDNDKHHSLW